MHTDDIYCAPPSPADDHPFEPMSAEFLAQCRTILGDRVHDLALEDGLADLRDFFLAKLARGDQGRQAITAAMMMVALHDAVIASLPIGVVPEILALAGHDPRTLACVTGCETLVPEGVR